MSSTRAASSLSVIVEGPEAACWDLRHVQNLYWVRVAERYGVTPCRLDVEAFLRRLEFHAHHSVSEFMSRCKEAFYERCNWEGLCL